jgi:hypothetical protein
MLTSKPLATHAGSMQWVIAVAVMEEDEGRYQKRMPLLLQRRLRMLQQQIRMQPTVQQNQSVVVGVEGTEP